MIISIEGNIGSGKTTLLSLIKQKLNGYIGRGKRVVYVEEPVDEWEAIRDDNGRSMLDLLYSDAKTHSFAFQMMAFITRYQGFVKARKENPGAIHITERCLQTDAEVFAKMLRDSGDIQKIHYRIYEKWAQALASQFTPDYIVYVRADPSTSMKRVEKRSRSSEAGISLQYLEACHEKHETWIHTVSAGNSSQVVIFDANQEFVGDQKHRVDDVIKQMNKFIL